PATPAAPRTPPPLDRPHHALGDRPGARWDDHERPADLRGLRALREPRRTVAAESAGRRAVPPLEPAGRLARRGAELALRPHVAPRHRRPRLSRLSGEERRVACPAVSTARRPGRARHGRLLPAAAQTAPAAGKTQPASEARLLEHLRARRPRGAHRLRDLQADAARLAYRLVRGGPGRPILALLDRTDLRCVRYRSRASGVGCGAGVAAGHDHGVVPGEVPEP